MERQEMVFGYTDSDYEECEEMQWGLKYYEGTESEVEYYDDHMVLVWYE